MASSSSMSRSVSSVSAAVARTASKPLLQARPVGGRLGQAQPALAPKNAGQFLNQMLLCGPVWGVLGDEPRDQVAIFGRVLPRRDGVIGIAAPPTLRRGQHGMLSLFAQGKHSAACV